ncbi:MAG: ABC transporter substrate-binding protein [Bacteroidia bacterium]|nr:ABC transporter substrate-binding protein [Bacteroidia bacterium]
MNIRSLLLGFIALMLVSCGGSNKRDPLEGLREGKGGINYGGVFHTNEVEYLRSLYPPNIGEVIGFRIASQCYEGLVRFSTKDLSITPCIAESWDIDSTATKYTFYIRKGVYFQDDECFEKGKGREVTAKDIKWCFDKICESDPLNQGFWVFKDRVVGANEYFQSTVDKDPLEGGVEGIKVIDEYTLEIRLEKSFASFLGVLGTQYGYIYPIEALDNYGIDLNTRKCVGTGPFILKELSVDENVILVRNENYWGKDEFGNQLPYLDAIKFSFIKELQSEFFEFVKGNLEFTYLPILIRDQVVDENMNLKGSYDRFNISKAAAMVIQYYGFQHQHELFKNKLIRQAFNYAVDRDKIVKHTLKGDGIPAFSGIVPPAFTDYNIESVKGYNYDPDKAKKLLSEAGYPNGEGFPKVTLQLNSGGSKNFYVAEAIKKMLEDNLNINIGYRLLPMAQHYENVENGKCNFWRAGWLADYPDPENFLTLLYGPHVPKDPTMNSYVNSVRYQSAKFDSIFNQALQTIDKDKRYQLYSMADQVAMNDAAIMPLFYEERYRLTHKHVQNFNINAQDFRDYKVVYFKQDKEQLADR